MDIPSERARIAYYFRSWGHPASKHECFKQQNQDNFLVISSRSSTNLMHSTQRVGRLWKGKVDTSTANVLMWEKLHMKDAQPKTINTQTHCLLRQRENVRPDYIGGAYLRPSAGFKSALRPTHEGKYPAKYWFLASTITLLVLCFPGLQVHWNLIQWHENTQSRTAPWQTPLCGIRGWDKAVSLAIIELLLCNTKADRLECLAW